MRSMRWTVPFTMAMFMVAGACVGQDPAPVPTPGPAPKIEFAEPDFDFGQIAEGEQVPHVYRFKNGGKGVLTINQVQASCGCTAAVVSEEHRTRQPGEEGEIKVVFNSQGRTGSQHKIITVHSNDPQRSQVQLSLKGEVRSVLDIQPPILSFGEVFRGSFPEPKDVKLIATDGQTFAVQGVRQSSDDLDVKWLQNPDGSTTLKIGIAAKDNLVPKPFNERLDIQTTHPKKPNLTLPVSWNLMGEITASPNLLTLVARHEQPNPEQSFTVVKRTEGSFAIQEVWGLPEYLESTVETILPGKQYGVKIRLKGQAPPNQVRVQVKVMTDDPKNTELPVTVGVIAELPPAPAPAQPEAQK